MVNIYTPTDKSNDISVGVFEFKQYGNTMFRPKINWVDHNREDVIQYNEGIHKAELEKYIRISQNASIAHKQTVLGIVKKYWDCFCKEGARRPIIDYEFTIDTGTSKPVCCRKPRYGPYESKIILELMKDLLKMIGSSATKDRGEAA